MKNSKGIYLFLLISSLCLNGLAIEDNKSKDPFSIKKENLPKPLIQSELKDPKMQETLNTIKDYEKNKEPAINQIKDMSSPDANLSNTNNSGNTTSNYGAEKDYNEFPIPEKSYKLNGKYIVTCVILDKKEISLKIQYSNYQPSQLVSQGSPVSNLSNMQNTTNNAFQANNSQQTIETQKVSSQVKRIKLNVGDIYNNWKVISISKNNIKLKNVLSKKDKTLFY